MTKPIKTFVLHVKHGYEDRKIHIEKTMSDHNIPFQYILDGDIADLTTKRLDTYFSGARHSLSPGTSCAMKHILTWQEIVDSGVENALVIEDDIFLSKNFNRIFEMSVEQSQSFDRPFYIGYAAACLRLVPRSSRKKNVVIYKANDTQCTGAYFVNRQFAVTVLEYIKQHKCALPIDIFLATLCKEGVFDAYWSYPVIAKQGSHDGRMKSSITPHDNKSPLLRRISRSMTTNYKHMIYMFR